MQDSDYRDLLIGILTNLEPRFEEKGFYFANELDEFGEITFVT